MITKEQILNTITEEEIFRKYIRHPFRIGVPFLSELQPEKHPSANVFVSSKSGSHLYKDFRRDDALNCFSYVMELFGADFKGALSIIASDFKLTDTTVKKTEKVKIQKIMEEKIRTQYKYDVKDWDYHELKYWEEFGITQETLEEYDVMPLKWFQTIKEDIIYPEVESRRFNPIYLIIINKGVKIYRPYEEPKRKWLSNTRVTDVFGLKQAVACINNKGGGKLDKLGLLAGQKDILSLYSNTKIRSVGLNAEGSKLKFSLYLQLSDLADWLFVLYDNDKTGIINSGKIASEYGITQIEMNKFLKYTTISRESSGINDVADWYKYMTDNSLRKDRVKLLIEYEYGEYNKNKSCNPIKEEEHNSKLPI